jgi:hypothetical protein
MAEHETPLELPAQIYSPFDAAEVKRLRNYVADVEGLRHSTFFKNPNTSLRISGHVDQPLTAALDYPGEEAVHAVVGRFRQIHNHSEPTSYNQVLKLLGRHVHERESPLQLQAQAALKKLRDWEGEVAKISGVAIDVNGEALTGPILIDLFLHGHYLHKGNAKSDKLDAFPMPLLLLNEFIAAMLRLMHVYWIGRNAVAYLLDTPSLLPESLPVA